MIECTFVRVIYMLKLTCETGTVAKVLKKMKKMGLNGIQLPISQL